MSPIQETVFDLLLNALLQSGLLASRCEDESKASIFLLSHGAPLLSGGSGYQHPLAIALNSSRRKISAASSLGRWRGESRFLELAGSFQAAWAVHNRTWVPKLDRWHLGGACSASAGPLQPSCSSSSSAAEKRIRAFGCPSWDGQPDHRGQVPDRSR